MIDSGLTICLSVSMDGFNRSVQQATTALRSLSKLFEDREKWYVITEGQWPDKFILLNRYVRTGLRPPFMFND